MTTARDVLRWHTHLPREEPEEHHSYGPDVGGLGGQTGLSRHRRSRSLRRAVPGTVVSVSGWVSMLGMCGLARCCGRRRCTHCRMGSSGVKREDTTEHSLEAANRRIFPPKSSPAQGHRAGSNVYGGRGKRGAMPKWSSAYELGARSFDHLQTNITRLSATSMYEMFHRWSWLLAPQPAVGCFWAKDVGAEHHSSTAERRSYTKM